MEDTNGPPKALVELYKPGDGEWSALEHVKLFHWMMHHHRCGRGDDQCAMKLWAMKATKWARKFLWDDFEWCWDKASRIAYRDPMGICDGHMRRYLEHTNWEMDDTEWWDEGTPRYSKERCAAMRVSCPQPIRYTVEKYLQYFQHFETNPCDQADVGEVADRMMEQDVGGWNYNEDDYVEMVSCALQMATNVTKHNKAVALQGESEDQSFGGDSGSLGPDEEKKPAAQTK